MRITRESGKWTLSAHNLAVGAIRYTEAYPATRLSTRKPRLARPRVRTHASISPVDMFSDEHGLFLECDPEPPAGRAPQEFDNERDSRSSSSGLTGLQFEKLVYPAVGLGDLGLQDGIRLLPSISHELITPYGFVAIPESLV